VSRFTTPVFERVSVYSASFHTPFSHLAQTRKRRRLLDAYVSSEREGWFQCENCGTEYPLEWMKIKFQMTHSVKIEGDVQIEGIASVDNLYKRACSFLEAKEWKKADSYFDKILDIKFEYAKAYIGKICAKVELKSESEIPSYFNYRPIEKVPEFQAAMRFAESDYRLILEGYLQPYKDHKNYMYENSYINGKKMIEEGCFSNAQYMFENLCKEINYKDSVDILRELKEHKHENLCDEGKRMLAKGCYSKASIVLRNLCLEAGYINSADLIIEPDTPYTHENKRVEAIDLWREAVVKNCSKIIREDQAVHIGGYDWTVLELQKNKALLEIRNCANVEEFKNTISAIHKSLPALCVKSFNVETHNENDDFNKKLWVNLDFDNPEQN